MVPGFTLPHFGSLFSRLNGWTHLPLVWKRCLQKANSSFPLFCQVEAMVKRKTYSYILLRLNVKLFSTKRRANAALFTDMWETYTNNVFHHKHQEVVCGAGVAFIQCDTNIHILEVLQPDECLSTFTICLLVWKALALILLGKLDF